MDSTERLLATLEVQQLKSRYCRLLDTKEWDGFQQLFAADAEFDMRDGRGEGLDPQAVIRGAANIAAFVRDSVQPLTTVHHCHAGEVQIIGSNAARAVWPMEDFLWAPEGADMPFRHLRGWGHYHETYLRREGRWLIQTLRLSRIRIEVT
jgi:hypothetical protein